MKKMLFFSALVLVTGIQAFAQANRSSFAQVKSAAIFDRNLMATPASQTDVTVPLRSGPISKGSQGFANVVLDISNYGIGDKDIYLYNDAADVNYYLNISPNQHNVALTVLEGNYDVFIVANDNGVYNHTYYVGCGSAVNGHGQVSVYDTDLNASCYIISCD